MNTCEHCDRTITSTEVNAGDLHITEGLHIVHRSCHASDSPSTALTKKLWLEELCGMGGRNDKQ